MGPAGTPGKLKLFFFFITPHRTNSAATMVTDRRIRHETVPVYYPANSPIYYKSP
jgi:hypothetical protein